MSLEEKQKRSPHASDLDVLKEFTDNLEALDKIKNGFVFDGSITVASDGGYVIAEIWWDPESESWRVDFARNGEDV